MTYSGPNSSVNGDDSSGDADDTATEPSEDDPDDDGWAQRVVNAVKWVVQTFEGHAGADNLRNRKR